MGEPRWPFPETVGVYRDAVYGDAASAVTGIRAHTIGTLKHNGSTTMQGRGLGRQTPGQVEVSTI